MNDPSKAPSIPRVLGVSLVGVVATLVAGYIVWSAKSYLAGIHPLLYGLVLLVAMVLAIRITTGRLFKELREHAQWREEEQKRGKGP